MRRHELSDEEWAVIAFAFVLSSNHPARSPGLAGPTQFISRRKPRCFLIDPHIIMTWLLAVQ